MKQRGSTAIVILILESLKRQRRTKTKLAEELVLNYSRAEKYVGSLISLELIDYDWKGRTLGITERGLEFFQSANEMACLIKPIESLINKYRLSDAA